MKATEFNVNLFCSGLSRVSGHTTILDLESRTEIQKEYGEDIQASGGVKVMSTLCVASSRKASLCQCVLVYILSPDSFQASARIANVACDAYTARNASEQASSTNYFRLALRPERRTTGLLSPLICTRSPASRPCPCTFC